MRFFAALALVAALTAPARADDELATLQHEFTARTGAALVFTRAELPPGDWYDEMPELDAAGRIAAARILVAEAGKYPAGWLGSIGLHQVGVFRALVNQDGDGFRPYDDAWGGYVYYGLWSGKGALAAAYYTDGQLPLTFHHEVFHHIDGADGFTDDDARFREAITQDDPYPALAIGDADLATLAGRAGDPLTEAVGSYSAKGAGEDQAETARWLMSHLATGLWQATTRPDLPGSQRILHVIAEYGAAGGPDLTWLVDTALGRDRGRGRAAFQSAVEVGARVVMDRIAPSGSFVVWGREGKGGGNPTLRDDIGRIAGVAESVAGLAPRLSATAGDRRAAAARFHDLLDRYQAFIAARWSISEGTRAAFAAAGARIDRALGGAAAPAPTNPYLDKVDAAIADPAWRAAIRAVQPATVKLGGGSGVNLAATGLVLTAGHVVDALGSRLTVRFPDGREFRGVTVAYDDDLDLGLVRLEGARGLPVAALADAAPRAGDDVAIVGQPGTRDPDGEPTGYQPWHVSTGHIRGFRAGSRTGEQHLGRTKHDAWTYWGHSGSPLFDRSGRVVALHNSWDSKTAMRHAVTWEALRQFLADADAE